MKQMIIYDYDIEFLFEYLEKEYNHNNSLYFKLTNKNCITSYFKKNNEKFTTYNIEHLLKTIDYGEWWRWTISQ